MRKTYSIPRVKTLNGYSAHARWIAELENLEPLAFLARCQVEDIPSPYRYSPSIPIDQWNGKHVVLFETSHRKYEVFEVPSTLLRFNTDEQATDWHIRFCKKEKQTA